MLTLNDYQDACRQTALNHDVNHMAYGLLEEAGEVAGIMKRVHRGDMGYSTNPSWNQRFISQHAKDLVRKELGDVLWYAAMLADVIDVRLEDVAQDNLKKLKDRAERKVLTGTGDNR